ncbi:hypothetical protein JOM56_013419 [Amanita muscaria]
MGRPRVYTTPEELKAANRAKSKRYYERNKTAIQERRREKYKARAVEPSNSFISPSSSKTCPQERTVSHARRHLDCWHSSAARVKKKYDKLTSGSPKNVVNSIVQDIISANQKAGPLHHAINVISSLLTQIQRTENQILQQHGLCDSYQQVVAIRKQVKELNIWLEDILSYCMLNISELCVAFQTPAANAADKAVLERGVPRAHPPESEVDTWEGGGGGGLNELMTEDWEEMAPRSWATEEQRAFLTSHLDEFFNMQNAGKLSSFWPKIQNLWFQQWHEPGMEEGTPDESTAGLREDVQERKKQLQNWFYNNRDNRIRGGARVKPLKLELKQKHTLTAVQLYSAANYEENIKKSVISEIQDRALLKTKMLEVIKRKTAEQFLAEPPEVRQYFKDQSEQLKEQRAQGKRATADKDEPTPTPASYAAEVKNLNQLVDLILADLGKRTGWTFLVLAGGPDPTTGKIRTRSYNEGRNMLGQTFGKCHAEFEAEYVKPFMNFLKQVYPPSVREARRLVATKGRIHAVGAESGICDGEMLGNLPNETSNQILMGVMDDVVAPTAEVTVESHVGTNSPTVGNSLDRSIVNEVTELNHQTHYSAFQDDEGNPAGHFSENGFQEDLIDPTLRAPSETTQVPRDPSPCDSSGLPFPDHPPQTWETYAQHVTLPRQEDLHECAQMAHCEAPSVQSCTNTMTVTEPAARPRRQPTTAKEAGPFALRNEDSVITAWLKKSYNCLLGGGEDPESVWSMCIEKWVEFEKSLPLANLSSGRLPATKK